MSDLKEGKKGAARRDFLKLAGLSAVTGGAALAMGKTDAQASPAQPSETSEYRETEHVRNYYDLARF